jgi:hypothetical protein
MRVVIVINVIRNQLHPILVQLHVYYVLLPSTSNSFHAHHRVYCPSHHHNAIVVFSGSTQDNIICACAPGSYSTKMDNQGITIVCTAAIDRERDYDYLLSDAVFVFSISYIYE